MLHATILRRERRELPELRSNPRLGSSNSSQEEIIGDGSSTTSVVMGLEFLRDVLGLDADILENGNVTSAPAPVTQTSPSGQSVQSSDCELLMKLKNRWTDNKLDELAVKLRRNEVEDSDVRVLKRILDIIDKRSSNLKIGTTGRETGHEMTVTDLRVKLRPLYDACQQKDIHVHNNAPLPSVPFGRQISIASDADVLLNSYQSRVSYPEETKIIAKHQYDNSATPWMAPDDLTWFLWRRSAPTSSFKKLYGRIDEDLQPGTYRLEFEINGTSWDALGNVGTLWEWDMK